MKPLRRTLTLLLEDLWTDELTMPPLPLEFEIGPYALVQPIFIHIEQKGVREEIVEITAGKPSIEHHLF